MSPRLIVDHDQLAAFVSAMFRHADQGSFASLRTFLEMEDGRPPAIRGVELNGDPARLIEAATRQAQMAADLAKPCVFSPPVATFSGPKKAAERDLANGLALSVELDRDTARSRKRLEFLLGEATAVVASGGEWTDPATGEAQPKLHIHWRLKEPTRTPEAHARLKQARTIATALVGGDCTNKPVVHPIRWPGSWHRKAEPRLCRILDLKPEAEIDLHGALATLLDIQPEFRGAGSGGARSDPGEDRETAELIRRVTTGEEYHGALRDLAWRYLKAGMAGAQVVLTLRGLMDASTGPHDERWQHRRDQIPMLVRTAEEKIKSQAGATSAVDDGWPEPDRTILSEHRLPAVPLPLEVFGSYWGEWSARQAEAKSCPADYVAAVLLSGASVLVGNARWGSPWESWAEPPILWTAAVGLPSSGKSPGQDAVCDLLAMIEADANANRDDRLTEWDTAARAAKLHLELWEGDCKVAIKKGLSQPPRPPEAKAPARPTRRRIATSDTTIEKAAHILIENQKGLLLKRDELSGWLGSLERYGGNGSDRAFYLESYGGRAYIVDRQKNPEPLAVPALSIAITGGIQPDRLNTLVLNGDDDGLAARFIYVWPERVPPRRPTKVPPTGAKTKLNMLFALEEERDDKGARVVIPFMPDAAAAIQAYRQQVAEAEPGLAGMILSWSGKLPGFVVRLATVLEHLYWCGDREGLTLSPQAISRRAAVSAVAFLDAYAVPMARRCFGDAALPERDRDAIAIARWLMSQESVPEVLNARALRHAAVLSARDPERYDAALDELAEAGWVRAAPARAGGTGGRNRKDWEVNPRIRRPS